MELGRRNVRHLDQWDTKGRNRLFTHQADHRAGGKGRSAGICGRVPFFLRKELSAIPAKDVGSLQERKPGRGGDGGKSYPFPDLFHLWAYAGTVYFLYTDGKCVPAFKRQLAVPHGGSMETLPGRNFTEITLFYAYSSIIVFAARKRPRYVGNFPKTIVWTFIMSAILEILLFVIREMTLDVSVIFSDALPTAVFNTVIAVILYPILKKTLYKEEKKKKLLIA